MKPDPLSDPDENPPPTRKDADGEKISGDAVEKDLWDFSDEGELKPYKSEGKKAADPAAAEKRDNESSPGLIPPAPRKNRRDYQTFTQNVSKKAPLEKRSGEPKADSVAAEKNPAETAGPIAKTSPLKVEPAFDDLDGPVEPVVKSTRTPRKGKGRNDKIKQTEAKTASIPEPEAGIPELAPEPEPEVLPAAAAATEVIPAPEPVPPAETAAAAEIPPLKELETLPAGAPATDKKPLSSLERSCLIAFAVLLLGGAFFLFHALHKLPEKPRELSASDFPIKGKKLEALKVDSYWRAPITEGPTVDTFRRGTVLLPVLDLQLAGGPAAVRVFFRNSSGELVGDPVTRPVGSATTLKIAASAGFDDLGMHAAYRAGDAKPWKVEILEGPSVGAPGDQFKKLFEIPISTERR